MELCDWRYNETILRQRATMVGMAWRMIISWGGAEDEDAHNEIMKNTICLCISSIWPSHWLFTYTFSLIFNLQISDSVLALMNKSKYPSASLMSPWWFIRDRAGSISVCFSTFLTTWFIHSFRYTNPWLQHTMIDGYVVDISSAHRSVVLEDWRKSRRILCVDALLCFSLKYFVLIAGFICTHNTTVISVSICSSILLFPVR